jgi:beta-galactosidase
VLDAGGVLVPQANNHLKFKVEGAGSVIAVCNGDPTSHRPFQAAEMPAFNGLCLAIVRAEAGKIGKLAVSAAAEGVKPGSAEVTVK